MAFRSEFTELMTRDLYTWFMEAYDQLQPVYPQIFDVVPLVGAYDQITAGVGLGQLSERPEGDDIVAVNPLEGYTALGKARSFSSSFFLTDEFVQDAVARGARVLTGGTSEGRYYQPTVLDNVSADCRISVEEVFGPVVALYPFGEVQESIDLANNVDYGLQAGVFTRDLATAHRVADGLDCGGVMINDSSDYRIDAMPFGGTRGSGLGREGVAHAIHEMTEAKTYCFNL